MKNNIKTIFSLLFTCVMLMNIQYAFGINFKKDYLIKDNGNEIKLRVFCSLNIEDADLEKAIAFYMFHQEGTLEEVADNYAKKFKKLHFSATPRRTIDLKASEVFRNPETGLLCIEYYAAGETRVVDTSEKRFFTYDLNTHRIVQLKELVQPSLQNHLISQGIDIENVTNINTFGHLFIALVGKTEVRMTPFKLYKHMTDYALKLAGLDRENLERGITATSSSADGKIFDVVEKMPSFPGGRVNLMSFLANNIKYPVKAEENGIQGVVVCTFVVDSDGSISSPQIAKSVDPLLDREALRVVSIMPNWVPGMQNGTYIRVKYSLPITFRLR